MTLPLRMTSAERVSTALSHGEADRVPYILPLSMHGARELGLSLREYFSDARNVSEGQLRMRKKYGHDALYTLFYAAVEVEAWGGEVIFREDGPPNAGEPILRRTDDICRLEPPDPRGVACLMRVLEATERIKRRVGDEAPIVGAVISPFSLPVMQMGYEAYMDLLHAGDPNVFERLMGVNEEFCVRWANAQLRAGATAIGYFDPVASPEQTPREIYRRTGFEVARRTLARIRGPVAVHMGAAKCLGIVDLLAETGAAMIGVSSREDLGALKKACQGRIAILGNLNGIEMRCWTAEETETQVRKAIGLGAPGGGFLLSENHGEIPWQVPEAVLLGISEAVGRWGRYPLDWAQGNDR